MSNASREIEITRIVDAPAEMVFDAFTRPEHLEKWWGPEGFTVSAVESDPRPGGVFALVMTGPDGVNYPMRGVFREVDRPDRLVTEESAVDDGGRPLVSAVTTITFAEHDGKTELTLRATGTALTAEAVQMLDGMELGWVQSLRHLEDFVEGKLDRQIVLSRFLEAPRERVFEAWTTQEHVERWFGPRGFTLTVDEMDVRPGGTWRFTMHGPDGVDYPNEIVYAEVSPPEALVYVHGSTDPDDPAFRVTATFDEFMGNTILTMRMVFATAGDRDLVVDKYGAIEGGNETLDRLSEFLVAP
jgi:uncharacterized protein YndB with AHSA1/START domain